MCIGQQNAKMGKKNERAWTSWRWTPWLAKNIQNTIFFIDFENSFHEVTHIDLEPHQIFSFQNISTNTVAKGVQSFGPTGLWLAGCLSNGQNFLLNLHNYLMNKSWKFHEDILILLWVRAKWVKICCNQWTPNVH